MRRSNQSSDALLPGFLTAVWAFCVAIVFAMAERRSFGNLVREAPMLFAGVLAGLAALFAAIIAYVGATSRIRFDREIDARALAERRRNLMLQVENGARVLCEELKDKIRDLENEEPYGTDEEGNARIKAESLGSIVVTMPSQIEEGWKNLSLLPPAAITSLRQLSLRLWQAQSNIVANLALVREWKERQITVVTDPEKVLRPYKDALEAGEKMAKEIDRELEPFLTPNSKKTRDS